MAVLQYFLKNEDYGSLSSVYRKLAIDPLLCLVKFSLFPLFPSLPVLRTSSLSDLSQTLQVCVYVAILLHTANLTYIRGL